MTEIYILVITSRNWCQVLEISFHLFWQNFSRTLALSLTVAYLHYNCQAEESRITNMKARKALMGEKEMEWEIALKQWYHPLHTPWGVGTETGLLLSHSWVNYYYYCCKISMVMGSFSLVLFLISFNHGLNEQYNTVTNRAATTAADERSAQVSPGIASSAALIWTLGELCRQLQALHTTYSRNLESFF